MSNISHRGTVQDHRDDALDLEAQDETDDPTLASDPEVVEVTIIDEVTETETEIENADQEVL